MPELVASTGVVLAQVADDVFASVDPDVIRVAVATSRALTDADNGKVLECNALGDITLTAPATLAADWNASIVNVGPSRVLFGTSGGATIAPSGVILDNTGSADVTSAFLWHTSAGVFRMIASTPESAVIVVPLSDEATNLTTGIAKFRMRAPFAMVLTAVRLNTNVAPVGSTIIVDMNEGGVSVFSTRPSIDASERTSTTAAVPAVISDPNIADDAELSFDIDQIGSSTPGQGLKMTLIGYRV